MGVLSARLWGPADPVSSSPTLAVGVGGGMPFLLLELEECFLATCKGSHRPSRHQGPLQTAWLPREA